MTTRKRPRTGGTRRLRGCAGRIARRAAPSRSVASPPRTCSAAARRSGPPFCWSSRRAQAAFDKATTALNAAKGLAKGAQQGRRKALDKVADARQGMIDAFLDNSEISDLRLRIAEAKGTPLEGATARLRTARQEEGQIRGLVKQGVIKGKKAILALLTAEATTAEAAKALAEAGNQEIEDTLSRMDRVSRIRVLRLPKAQRGGAELQNIKKQARHAAKKEHADEKTIQDLTIEYLEQVDSNADDAKQRAEDAKQRRKDAIQKRKDALQKERDTVESIFNFRRSRTDNPVTQARLTVKEIDTLLGIPGLNANERRDLRARRNEAIRDRSGPSPTTSSATSTWSTTSASSPTAPTSPG
jgi:hypothetical protein